MEAHKERAHALLSASGASRWINCTPSARLEAQYAESTTSYADEGTMAHELAEAALRESLGDSLNLDRYYEVLNQVREKDYDADEFEANVIKYVDFVVERINALRAETGKEPTVLIEQKLDLSDWIPESFGTSDCSLVSDGVLEIIDLKYGKGVRVNADDNAQLKLYALGAVRATELLYDEVKTVRMSIMQPRLDHVSTFEISREDLFKWVEQVVKPAAEAAFSGKGEMKAGAHCQFCKHKPKCKALAELVKESVFDDFDAKTTRDSKTLTDAEIIAVYERKALIESFLNAVAENMLKEALAGKQWEGYKVVEGRSVRQISDKEAVKELLQVNKFEQEAYLKPGDLYGLGDLEKRLGKDNFRKFIEPYLRKPQGAPTMALITDKRPPYKSVENDFDEANVSELLD